MNKDFWAKFDPRASPTYKTKWCDFVYRSHGCRYGDYCMHAHTIYDYRGPKDKYIQRAIDRGLIPGYTQPPIALRPDMVDSLRKKDWWVQADGRCANVPVGRALICKGGKGAKNKNFDEYMSWRTDFQGKGDLRKAKGWSCDRPFRGPGKGDRWIRAADLPKGKGKEYKRKGYQGPDDPDTDDKGKNAAKGADAVGSKGADDPGSKGKNAAKGADAVGSKGADDPGSKGKITSKGADDDGSKGKNAEKGADAVGSKGADPPTLSLVPPPPLGDPDPNVPPPPGPPPHSPRDRSLPRASPWKNWADAKQRPAVGAQPARRVVTLC